MSDAQFNPKDEPILNVSGGCELNGIREGVKEAIESAGLRPCPHCGYCPTCGRPQNVPIYPPYPYMPFYGSPWTVTCGTGGVHTSV
jgi:hypothetical protein